MNEKVASLLERLERLEEEVAELKRENEILKSKKNKITKPLEPSEENWDRMIAAAYSANDAYDLRENLKKQLEEAINNHESTEKINELNEKIAAAGRSFSSYKGHTNRYAKNFTNEENIPLQTEKEKSEKLTTAYNNLQLARNKYKEAILRKASIQEIDELYLLLKKARNKFYTLSKKETTYNLPITPLIENENLFELKDVKESLLEPALPTDFNNTNQIEDQLAKDNKMNILNQGLTPTEMENMKHMIGIPKQHVEISKYNDELYKQKRKKSHFITKIRKSFKNQKHNLIKKVAKLATSLVLIATAPMTVGKISQNIENPNTIVTVINKDTPKLVNMEKDILYASAKSEEDYLGQNIDVEDNTPIYNGLIDAYLELNPIDEKLSTNSLPVTGAAYWNNYSKEIKKVHIWDQNYKQQIKNITDHGGEIIAFSTSLKGDKKEKWLNANAILKNNIKSRSL